MTMDGQPCGEFDEIKLQEMNREVFSLLSEPVHRATAQMFDSSLEAHVAARRGEAVPINMPKLLGRRPMTRY